jgi:isopentenyldiphosphate isomerase
MQLSSPARRCMDAISLHHDFTTPIFSAHEKVLIKQFSEYRIYVISHPSMKSDLM